MTQRFSLTVEQLLDVSRGLGREIDRGLEVPDQMIRALPTHVSSDLSPTGEALVVDLGGTNLRAARVALGSSAVELLDGPVTAALPVRRGEPLLRSQFLEAQVSLVKKLERFGELPLGYCFSYPAEPLPDGDARLIHWTKEVDVLGTEGECMGALLADALFEHGVQVSSVAVINDTVASLLAGLSQPGFDGHIGLIVGTGTNMALSLPTEAIPKLESLHHGPGAVPVNLESGNYAPPHLDEADERLDIESTNPGGQRFEKAVSGAYLGRLLALTHPEARFDGESGAAGLVERLEDPRLGATARAILLRSADLVAASLHAGIAGIQRSAQATRVKIVAEGGLFWGAPGYSDRVRCRLDELLDETQLSSVSVHIESVAQANLLGSAVAALAVGNRK